MISKEDAQARTIAHHRVRISRLSAALDITLLALQKLAAEGSIEAWDALHSAREAGNL